MKKIIFPVLLLFAAGFQIIQAQDDEVTRLELSIEEAENYALENNYDLLNSNLDVYSAKKQVWESISRGLPHVSGQFNYQHIPGEIPTITFSDTTSEGFPIAVKNTATYSVTVSQLVFSGEYIVGLMASQTFLQLSRSRNEKTALDVKESVRSAYYSILVLEANLNILDSTLQNLDEIIRDTRVMVDQGFMEETDYEQNVVTRNTNRNAMNSIENQLVIARYLFKIQLGLRNEDEVILTEDLDDILARIDYEALTEKEFRLENSVDYELLKLQEDASELSLKREKAAFLPSINAFYTYQDKTNKAVFDFTLNHIIGVNINVPIFSSGQRLAVVKQAEVDLEKNRNTRLKMSEMLIMQAKQARLQFINAYNKYKIQQENIELSERIYERTAVKFREGVSGSMDLNQANNQYLNNYSAYTNSIQELLNARLRYKKALNIL